MNHDFFSGSGSSYVIGKAVATEDDELALRNDAFQDSGVHSAVHRIGVAAASAHDGGRSAPIASTHPLPDIEHYFHDRGL